MNNSKKLKFLHFRPQEFETTCQLLSSVFQTTSKELTEHYQTISRNFEKDGWPPHFAPRSFFQSKNASFHNEIYEKSPSIAVDLPSFLELEDGNEKKPTIVVLGQDSKSNQSHENISLGTPYGLHHKGSREKLANTKLYFDMVCVLMHLGYRVYLTDIFKVWVCNPNKLYSGISLPKEDKKTFLEILEPEIENVSPAAVITWGTSSKDIVSKMTIGPTLSFPHPSGAANGAWKKLLDKSPNRENKLTYWKTTIKDKLAIAM